MPRQVVLLIPSQNALALNRYRLPFERFDLKKLKMSFQQSQKSKEIDRDFINV